MTKEEAMQLVKRKIEESKMAAEEKHFGKVTQMAISDYESGRARGLEDALAIIGMIDSTLKKL